ncbi:MAG: hypothetical protein JO145_08090 [Acidobacteriaceae bacterium]|nr:hypothetical protein [Acidobacteriaceae bacterium]MBV9764077.1 hypothetical protein [Acidobacteriaceae bacterium]
MDIFQFIVLSFCNLALIFWIIRRQGLASVEGYCAAYIGAAVLTDNLKLLFDYFVQPETLVLGAAEFNFRAYPTVVHIVALLVLMAGLYLGNSKPQPITRQCSADELDFVAYTGMALLVVGLIMSAIAIYLTGAYNAVSYFSTLDNFRGGDPGKSGGFWYRGADVAVFGLALIMAGWGKTWLRLSFVLFAMVLAEFFLKANKGGAEIAVLFAAITLYTYNPSRFRSIAKPRVVLALAALSVLGIGVKFSLIKETAFTWKNLSGSIVGPIEARWGDQGLYRGYCEFVNLLPKYQYLFRGYREGMFALTEAWVPRDINTEKRDQPTKGLGFMIHADKHTYKEETPSIELVGSVFADNGFYTLTAYLIIVGFLLGVLRKYAAGTQSSLQWHIAYVCFALFGGLSPEAGITTLMYTFIFTFGITGVAHLIVVGMFTRRFRSASALAQYRARRDWRAEASVSRAAIPMAHRTHQIR